ncbi:hypothetical protein, partial [Salmonella enterica]|uniref:hypothetical protein n=1 Tax=Salmonella enterica TaxID=28901 RepID=UPI0032970F18
MTLTYCFYFCYQSFHGRDLLLPVTFCPTGYTKPLFAKVRNSLQVYLLFLVCVLAFEGNPA